MNSKLEPAKVIEDNISKLTVRVAEESANVHLVSSKLEEMAKEMQIRHLHYEVQLKYVFEYIKVYFGKLFDDQPAVEGNLQLDHKNCTLKIETIYKGGANQVARNLSGGEGSFTTVALVLAVWSKLLNPFYMLDEFDVYLDMTNR